MDPCTRQKGKETPQGMINPLEWDAKHLGCWIHPLEAAMCQALRFGGSKHCREQGSFQGEQPGSQTWTLSTKGVHSAPLLYLMQDEDVWRPTEKWCNQLFCNVVPMLLGDEEEERGSRQHFDLDTFLSDISDTLFTMTQMPSTHQALPEDGRCPRPCFSRMWRRNLDSASWLSPRELPTVSFWVGRVPWHLPCWGRGKGCSCPAQTGATRGGDA